MNPKESFTRCYDEKLWEGGGSGDGSTPEFTRFYREFLYKFMKSNNIRSVTDIGCGDWQFSRLISWECNYLGIDLVGSVIKNNKKYENDHIRFTEGIYWIWMRQGQTW